MKRLSLAIALVSLGAGLCLAQDSSLVREPAALTPPPTTTPAMPAVPLLSLISPGAEPRAYRFAAGFRYSVLDKTSFFVSGRPHRSVQLELGGYGTRRKSEGRYQYTYRAQAEADVLFLQGNQNRLFAGVRYSWERSREQNQYYDYYYVGSSAGTYWQAIVTSRFGLTVGVDLTSGRFGLQLGLTPLYDQQKTITQNYPVYHWYSVSDTSVTHKENETVMDFKNIFVAMRVMF